MADYVLTIPDQEAAQALADTCASCSGNDRITAALVASPLAKSELGKPPKGHFGTCLYRYAGTDLVQWHYHGADCFWHPIGRLMRIVKPSIEPIPVTP